MTSSHARKAAAHELSRVSGVPYQASLQTLAVLRELAGLMDVGELKRFVGREGEHTLCLPTDDDHSLFLRNLFDLYGVTSTPATAEPVSEAESILNVPFACEGHELWASMGMTGSFRPGGRWEIETADLARSLETVEADWTLTVSAKRAGEAEVPPDGFADAWLCPDAGAVHPTWTAPGPGFEWWGVSFESIGQVAENVSWHGPDGCPDPRTCECQRWPAMDQSRRGIVMPGPLFTAYQALADWQRERTFAESRERRDEMQIDGSYWIGVDLPTYETIWMKVPPHTADLAAPTF